MKVSRRTGENSKRKIGNVLVRLWTDIEGIPEPPSQSVDPDQVLWSLAVHVEGGRFYADLFSRQDGKAPVKFATLSVIRNAKESQLVLEVLVDRADRMAVARGTEVLSQALVLERGMAAVRVEGPTPPDADRIELGGEASRIPRRFQSLADNVK